MIEGDLKSKIEELKNVRNGLAHSWSERDVLYKNISLYDNIEEFRKDAKEVWLSLIEIYMKEEVKHLRTLLNKLGEKENPEDIQTKSDVVSSSLSIASSFIPSSSFCCCKAFICSFL